MSESRVCVRVCVRACVRGCVCVRARVRASQALILLEDCSPRPTDEKRCPRGAHRNVRLSDACASSDSRAHAAAPLRLSYLRIRRAPLARSKYSVRARREEYSGYPRFAAQHTGAAARPGADVALNGPGPGADVKQASTARGRRAARGADEAL